MQHAVQKSFLLITGLVLAAISAADSPCPAHWDMARLQAPPTTWPAPAFTKAADNPEWAFTGEGVRALYYEGPPWQGRPTRVFAWYGAPESPEGKPLPAMVLVHGGGGTAFDEWVRIWNRQGYAAIAMDLTGTHPGGKPGERPRHEAGGPGNSQYINDLSAPLGDQWVYHAVSNIIRAHSLLRSFPEIDPDRIGLTGISWGGYLTCIAAGVDHRFRLAMPVYGCGFHTEAAHAQEMWKTAGPAVKQQWFETWDPARFLPCAPMPMLFITGSNDFFAPLRLHSRSVDLPQGPCTRSVPVGMQHSHVHGWRPKELYAFADSLLRDGQALLRISGAQIESGRAHAHVEGETAIREVVLVYTDDPAPWRDKKWREAEAAHDPGGRQLSAEIPDHCLACYFNLTDARGYLTSSACLLPKAAS